LRESYGQEDRHQPNSKDCHRAGRREQAVRRQFDNNPRIKRITLKQPGKKGILGVGTELPMYEAEILEQAVVEITYVAKVKIAVTVGKRLDEELKLCEGVSGGWPDELPRDVFDRVDYNKLLALLKQYQEMAHPGFSFQEVRPEYEIVEDSKIGRRSYVWEDVKLITAAAFIKGHGTVNLLTDNTKIANFAFEIIQHHASQRLARFLFNLPRCHALVAKGAKPIIIIIEHHLMDVYNGVENVLFEVYEDLGEGQIFNDDTVTRKLLSFVERCKTH
jgi:hypothetical protein